MGVHNGPLVKALHKSQACSAEEIAIHDEFSSKILSEGFPCVAAKSAFNRHTYRMGVYDNLGSHASALAICHDLYEFAHEMEHEIAHGDAAVFTTFVAVFKQPDQLDELSELSFEKLLWQQLQGMHSIDSRYFAWDPTVSDDPDDPNFSFSIGEHAYFVVGLHSGASRLARRFSYPCIVFNPHAQFERLKTTGHYAKLQKAIRQRDMALQGFINPVLANFGQDAESRQYSGRAVSDQWKCPFHHQSNEDESLAPSFSSTS